MSRRRQDDDVITLTPEPGFIIESLVSTVIQMMRELDMDACINLPDNVVLEIDKRGGTRNSDRVLSYFL